MGAQGTTTINFGAFPGATDASTVITGQVGILSSASLVEAWLFPVATADHSLAEHYLDNPIILAGEIVANTGFTIRGLSPTMLPYYGQYTVAWVWN